MAEKFADPERARFAAGKRSRHVLTGVAEVSKAALDR
jgi:hypothetical protein